MATPSGVLSQYAIERVIFLLTISCSRFPIGSTCFSARTTGKPPATGVAILATVFLSATDVLRGNQVNDGRTERDFSGLEQAGAESDGQSVRIWTSTQC